MVDFIQQTNTDDLPDKASIIDAFFTFAQHEQLREAEALIKEKSQWRTDETLYSHVFKRENTPPK